MDENIDLEQAESALEELKQAYETAKSQDPNGEVTSQLYNYYKGAEAYVNYLKGNSSASDTNTALNTYAAGMGSDGSVNAGIQDVLNNGMASEASQAANDFTEHMRDTSITSAADQYSSLGLNPASVMSTGGAGIGGSSTAQVGRSNAAQEARLNNVNKKAAMTRTLLGLAGGLASSGIYGGALAASRVAAAKLASSTSHSALQTLNIKKDKGHEDDPDSWYIYR